MKNNPGIMFDDAYIFVKSKRPIINPNEGFIKQLISVTPEVIKKKETINVKKNIPQSHPYIVKLPPKKRFDQPKFIEGSAQILRNVTKASSKI